MTEKGDTNADLVLEEAEVLPYDSIFDWDLQDPLGYYREMERYNELMQEYGNDEMKAIVIEGMWRDREKYQILRRFMWPPKGKLFYTRGYYEDYEARPTINVPALSLSKKQKEKEAKLKKGPGFFSMLSKFLSMIYDFDAKKGKKRPSKKNKKAPPPIIAGQKRSLAEFDPSSFNRVKLEVKSLPKDTRASFIKRMFPKAKVTIHYDKETGSTTAELDFDNEMDASEAFRQARQEKIGADPVTVFPYRRGAYFVEKSKQKGNEEQDSKNANEAKYLESTTTKEAPMFITVPKEAPMFITVPKEVPIAEESGKGKDKKKKKKKQSVAPSAKKNFSDYDPETYDLLKLEIKNIPEGTTSFYLQSMFPKGVVKMHPNKKTGELNAVITFQDPNDTAAGFKENENMEVKGTRLEMAPKLKGKSKEAVETLVADTGEPEEKKKKKKKKKAPSEPEVETIEEVSYEVVKKPKDPNRKKKKKHKKHDPDLAPPSEDTTASSAVDIPTVKPDEGGEKKKKKKKDKK